MVIDNSLITEYTYCDNNVLHTTPTMNLEMSKSKGIMFPWI